MKKRWISALPEWYSISERIFFFNEPLPQLKEVRNLEHKRNEESASQGYYNTEWNILVIILIKEFYNILLLFCFLFQINETCLCLIKYIYMLECQGLFIFFLFENKHMVKNWQCIGLWMFFFDWNFDVIKYNANFIWCSILTMCQMHNECWLWKPMV